MKTFAFTGRARNALAVAMSLAAVLAIAAYVTAPVSAQPSFIARFRASKHPVVRGVVKSQPRVAPRSIHVVLIFKDRKGAKVRTRRLRVNRHYRWHAAIPRRAAVVIVVVHDHGRVARHREHLKRGRSLRVTAVFPAPREGLLPGVFPY